MIDKRLPKSNDLFTSEETRGGAKLEKIMELPISEINDFSNHPFKVQEDEEMQKLTESIKQYGVLVPCLVRAKESGYEMVAGHRRKRASELAGYAKSGD
jgi:ParB family chromosome partitioning protein